MPFRGGHSKYNRYIQRFVESCGGKEEIDNISIKRGGIDV